MTGKFSYFVILAEMRTGSNFLEANLNDYPGLMCHGEVFNPHFIGHAGQTDLFGLTVPQREQNPVSLIARMKEETSGLPGFRFFHDHDPRVLKFCLSDPDCAKIILTRNPLETYVSREIARQTGQWRLNDLKHAKTARMTFDAAVFDQHLTDHQAFQQKLQHALQTSGQTAFYISYEDIPDVDVLNGLAIFLGVNHKARTTSKATKKQNPRPLEDLVVNFAQMEQALKQADHFAINRTPNFEPRRGPGIPGYIAASKAPLLFMPIPAAPDAQVCRWLADLDGVSEDALQRGFTQKTLRHWKRQAKTHRSFTVVRHPVARLHDAFTRHILMPGSENYAEIRDTLTKTYKLPLPDTAPQSGYALENHRAAFIGFAGFIKGNLDGQTSIRVDGSWASQSELISGMGQFALPDHIFRESDLAADLQYLTGQLGLTSPGMSPEPARGPYALVDFYDQKVEAAVRSTYQRDYMMFGFMPWSTI